MHFAPRFTVLFLATLAPLAALQAQSDFSVPYAITTLAGSVGTNGSTDGTGSAALFRSPYGVAVDAAGNAYVADNGNHTIRKITPGGTVTTFAGTAGSSGPTDGTGSAARFNFPFGVAVDGTGNVYVADYFNFTIRKITPAGVVTTLAGSAGNSGSADGTGAAARFGAPTDVAVDRAGNVYVADYGNHTIRKISPDGVVTTLAGTAGSSGSADGTGSAARFRNPNGVAVDRAGSVYVADYTNQLVRKITSLGVVTTLAGTIGAGGASDGTGTAARFSFPSGVAVDGAANVYVADYGNHLVRKIDSSGKVITLAGNASITGSANGTGNSARFNFPVRVAVDSSGIVYVTDNANATIRQGVPPLSLPAFTIQPSSQIVSSGSTANFSAVAIGTPAPTLQWQKNGANIAGATSGTLVLNSVQIADAESYSVIATNSNGSVASNAVSLILNNVTATVTLGGLNTTYSGFGQAATAATTPSALTVSFTYNGSATLPINAGTYAVVGTIVDANYQGSASGSLVIAKATPVITWVTPAPVQYGVTLSASQLNATANVAGSFVYTPAVGTLASAGNMTLSATFTPSNASVYNSVTVQRTLTVLVDVRIPTAFNVGGYYARNPDVQAIFGTDTYGAWIYYRDHGIYQGEIYDDLFRVEEYLGLYPELFAVFGTDLGSALVHWLTEGSIEGRLGRIPVLFSAEGYFARNADVATAVGNNPILAWGHYWAYGIYEGRAYDDELRVFEYLAINADLTAAFVNDWRSAALHWMRYGRTEGRLGRLPLTFSVSEYLNRSPDVSATWGTNPTTVFLHFWLYGIDEGRTYDELFRPDEYLVLNPDLASALGTDRRLAFKHWVRYGESEDRLGRFPE